MSLRLMGIKIGMTHIWKEEKFVPVTVIQVPETVVIQKKETKKHGYNAVKVAAIKVDKSRVNKPTLGQLKDYDSGYRTMYEMRDTELKDDQKINVELFSEGEKVIVSGISKGFGFSGAMRRHGFKGQPASHGAMSHRRTGSIGNRSTPGKVIKGRRMPGHLGNIKVTEMGKEVVQIVPEKNLLLIKGGVPGSKGSQVFINKWERK